MNGAKGLELISVVTYMSPWPTIRRINDVSVDTLMEVTQDRELHQPNNFYFLTSKVFFPPNNFLQLKCLGS